MKIIAAMLAVLLLAGACKEVPEGYDYGQVSNFGRPGGGQPSGFGS